MYESFRRCFWVNKKTEIPTIIIECGFLSNTEEAKRLTQTEYQKKIADAITECVLRIYNVTTETSD